VGNQLPTGIAVDPPGQKSRQAVGQTEEAMTNWSKTYIEWQDGDTVDVSVPFTWLLPKVAVRCKELNGQRVTVGGPAISLMPDYLEGVSIGTDADALSRHNPDATFTTRGCIRHCEFCAVPKIEGEFRELTDWEPKPIVCDNNLLAASRRQFDIIIDRLKPIKGVDFNQGLDARLLSDHHVGRLKELDLAFVRLSWDHVNIESRVMSALNRLIDGGIPKKLLRVYVLVGFRDTPDDALYRCQQLKDTGILPNVQRYQPLDCLVKNDYIDPAWSKEELGNFCRYWNRQVWLGHIPYKDYKAGIRGQY